MKRVLANVMYLAMGQMVTLVMGMGYTVIITHYLGPKRFGEIAFALSLLAVFGLIINFGTDSYLTRAVARVPERVDILASTAIATRVALLVPVLLALYVFVRLSHLGAELNLLLLILAVGQSPMVIVGVLIAIFQGREKMSLNALAGFARSVLGLVLAILIVWLHGSVFHFALIYLAVSVLLVALYLYWMSRFARFTWRITWRDVRELLLGGSAFLAKDVFLTIYTYIDAIILGMLAGSTAVGIYAPATRIFGAALFVPNIVAQATLPLLSRLGLDRASVDFIRTGRKVLALLVVSGVPITIGLIAFAGPLVTALFGSNYRSSTSVLMLLSLSLVPMFLNCQLADTCTASDRQWLWTGAMIGGTVANVFLNVVLIPAARHYGHSGALGAAAALLLTEVLQVVYGVIVLRDVVFHREFARSIVGALGAGAAQAGVLWVTSGLWLIVSEALAGFLYVALTVIFGAVPREDVTFFVDSIVSRISRNLIGRRKPGPAGPRLS